LTVHAEIDAGVIAAAQEPKRLHGEVLVAMGALSEAPHGVQKP
jgi:hypothetical protein